MEREGSGRAPRERQNPPRPMGKRGRLLKKRRPADSPAKRYPSQNPYESLREKEPSLPKGLSCDMLSASDREALRSLSKEHAENVGLHILAAYSLEGDNLPKALEHAKWAAANASRIDIARECLALVAYRSQDYKTALKEFMTVRRLNGESDWIPFIADCQRGLGRPERAIEIIRKYGSCAPNEAKIEMLMVCAGAHADKGEFQKAIKIADKLANIPKLPLPYKLRALEAKQNFLLLAGSGDEAENLEPQITELESKVFPEGDEEDFLDFDLENLDEKVAEALLSAGNPQ